MHLDVDKCKFFGGGILAADDAAPGGAMSHPRDAARAKFLSKKIALLQARATTADEPRLGAATVASIGPFGTVVARVLRFCAQRGLDHAEVPVNEGNWCRFRGMLRKPKGRWAVRRA